MSLPLPATGPEDRDVNVVQASTLPLLVYDQDPTIINIRQLCTPAVMFTGIVETIGSTSQSTMQLCLAPR
jgi:hypothetical protein